MSECGKYLTYGNRYAVWISSAFVGAYVPVRPQNGPILWEFYASLQHSHGRQGSRAPTKRLQGSAANRHFSERSAPINGIRISAAVSIGCYSLPISADRPKVREFRRVDAISHFQRLFFAYFFLTSQKKVCPRSDGTKCRYAIHHRRIWM